MASCPCCGDLLPAQMPSDQLCSACVRAMDTGSDTENPDAYRGVEQVHRRRDSPIGQSFQIERPIGITLIALLCFVLAVFFGIGVITALARFIMGRIAGDAVLYLTFDFSLSMLVAYCFGRGFWHLRDWARVISVFVLFLFLLPGGSASDWWIRGVDIVLILYLMSDKIKSTFNEAGQHDEVVVVDRWLRNGHRTERV